MIIKTFIPAYTYISFNPLESFIADFRRILAVNLVEFFNILLFKMYF